MTRFRNRAGGRRGSIVILAALMMTLLVGMLAFVIDLGYIVAVRAELQNAADAAALAAAQRLQQPFVQFCQARTNSSTHSQAYNIYSTVLTDTTTATSPICTAQNIASLNRAGGVSVTVPTSDVSFSYWDGTNAPVAASYPDDFPNTVTVVTRRDASANGPLRLFFAQIFGISTVNLTATASATIYVGDVSSLQVIPGVNAHILPIAFDVNYWKQFVATGVSPDGNTYPGSNGLPQVQVYPYPKNAPGAFGLLDVGMPANNAPAFRSWIDNGQTPNDVSYLVSNNLVPASLTAPQQWKSGPGLTSTLASNFQSVMNEPNLMPLFEPVYNGGNGSYQLNTGSGSYQATTGNGQGATYAIVGFVGVTVTQADGSGSSLIVSVQPMAAVDPTALIANPTPASAGTLTQFGTFQTTFVSAKLTQ
jgi:Flp pilus assembly protein TadG